MRRASRSYPEWTLPNQTRLILKIDGAETVENWHYLFPIDRRKRHSRDSGVFSGRDDRQFGPENRNDASRDRHDHAWPESAISWRDHARSDPLRRGDSRFRKLAPTDYRNICPHPNS